MGSFCHSLVSEVGLLCYVPTSEQGLGQRESKGSFCPPR